MMIMNSSYLINLVVKRRDNYTCRLMRLLSNEERMYIHYSSFGIDKKLDVAHVISRAQSPTLKYDIENMVLLNRYSHTNLDRYRDPVLGVPISQETVEKWWCFIVGEEIYTYLKSLKRK